MSPERGNGAAPEKFLTGSVLVICPHLDDAILSVTFLLAQNPQAACWTVFSGRPVPTQYTDWDRESGFADSDIALDARLAEEEAAFAGMPNPRRYFDLLDTQYRSGAADLRIVSSALRGWASQVPGPRVVILPVAAGLPPEEELPAQNGGALGRARRLAQRGARKVLSRVDQSEKPHIPAHPDHRAVRDQLIPVVRELDVTMAFYEDLPYHLAYSGEQVMTHHPVLRTLTGEHFSVAGDRVEKARRVAAYQSQLRGISVEGRRFDDASGHDEAENYWVVRR